MLAWLSAISLDLTAFQYLSHSLCWVCMVRFGYLGGHRSDFSEKLLDTSSMCGRAKMDLPLTKAELIRDNGSISGITNLRRGENHGSYSQKEE